MTPSRLLTLFNNLDLDKLNGAGFATTSFYKKGRPRIFSTTCAAITSAAWAISNSAGTSMAPSAAIRSATMPTANTGAAVEYRRQTPPASIRQKTAVGAKAEWCWWTAHSRTPAKAPKSTRAFRHRCKRPPSPKRATRLQPSRYGNLAAPVRPVPLPN